MFSSSKAGHLAQILAGGITSQVIASETVLPTPEQVTNIGHLIIQFLVAGFTIWATIKKARQQPEQVVKAPVAELVQELQSAGK